MTERRMSPTAANARVRRAIRDRFKILRTDSRSVREIRVDSPLLFAGRIDPREGWCRIDPREGWCRIDPREGWCRMSEQPDDQWCCDTCRRLSEAMSPLPPSDSGEDES